MDKAQKIITDETTTLLKQLGIPADISVTKDDEGVFLVSIHCHEDPSLLIGKFAEGLLAFQRILSIILFKKINEKITILVDINEYRERQKERLAQIADSIAVKVIEEKKPSTIRSFNAYERKIIHEYISKKYPDLKTYSEGEEPNRVLVIDCADKKELSELEDEFDDSVVNI